MNDPVIWMWRWLIILIAAIHIVGCTQMILNHDRCTYNPRNMSCMTADEIAKELELAK